MIGIKEANELASPPTTQSPLQIPNGNSALQDPEMSNEGEEKKMPKEFSTPAAYSKQHSSDDISDFSELDEYGDSGKGKESYTTRSSRGIL